MTKRKVGMMGGQSTLDLIKEIEGFSEDAYVDASGHSIGYGHFIKPGEEHLMQAKLTKDQAENLLKDDIAEHQATIRKNLKVEVSDQKMAALTSLVYNVGQNSKAVKQVVELLNQGREAEVGGILRQYNKAFDAKQGKKVENKALTQRRSFEEKLISGGEVGDLTKAYRQRNKEGPQLVDNKLHDFFQADIDARVVTAENQIESIGENARILAEIQIENIKIVNTVISKKLPLVRLRTVN